MKAARECHDARVKDLNRAKESYIGHILPLRFVMVATRQCPFQDASEHCERATRPELAGEAASERACGGVRGAKPLG